MTEVTGHGGALARAAFERYGVDTMFTLSGGHIFPFYDGIQGSDIRLVDVRHEQTATFAAEGLAKLTGRPGLAVLTAGPGVTNGLSAITTAKFTGSPIVVFGGRAPQGRWGSGSLQEFDHIPVLAPVTKLARTVAGADSIVGDVCDAFDAALTPHRGPAFLDFPLDVVFSQGSGAVPDSPHPRGLEADPSEVALAAELLAKAERPALIAGTDVFWGGASAALAQMVEAYGIPTFVNGLGRGSLPADHELYFSRTRGMLKSDADVVVVVGTPLDFRLSFGSFGEAKVIHIVDHPDQRASHVEVAASPAGDLVAILTAMAERAQGRSRTAQWVAKMRDEERSALAKDEPLLANASEPIKPTRVYGELKRALDRDAIVICDGGDFVSYAGKYIETYSPGCWMDPGPFGCLGTGMGYAIAARVVHPDRQVVVLMGDGAAGFSLMDADTLVRHKLPVVIVMGNNGIWGLEKHPMKMLYGYDVAADLQPGCRYDEVVAALGGAGEVVTKPDGIAAAIGRGFGSGVPYVVNILTDPEDVYPRSSNLA